MGFKKKAVPVKPEEVKESKTIMPEYSETELIRVFDPRADKVIKIDPSKEKDYKTKYLHCSGNPFSE